MGVTHARRAWVREQVTVRKGRKDVDSQHVTYSTETILCALLLTVIVD